MANKVIGDYSAANTIDGSTHYLLIQPGNSSTAYNKINRNVFLGVTGQPMDISTAQNVTNKTLNNTNIITLRDDRFTLQDSGDTTKQAVFELSGITTATTRTYTLPNASSTLADISSAQTLTNKTLTSPVITGGSITGSTITTDAIVGQTVATNGTIYGLTITGGKVGSNGVVTASITDNAVTASKLATNAITLGYTQITSTFTTTSTTPTQVTSLTSTVTIPTGGRRTKITVFVSATSATGAATGMIITLWDGTVGSGTQISALELDQNTATFQLGGICMAVVSPSAGSKTYNVGFQTTAGTASFKASATAPAFILVEAI